MSQNPQDVAKPLEVTARTTKSGPADVLEVGVKNTSTENFQSLILIELKLPVQMVGKAVSDAAVKARTNQKPKNMASLDGVVAAPAGWTVWAYNDPNEHIVVLRAFNSAIDINTSKNTGPLTAFAAGASLKLPIPLAAAALTTLYTLDYGYQTGQGKKVRVDGTLDIVPAGHGDWRPVVKFWSNKETTTMLTPGAAVIISWEIEEGIAATLRGPLPGGNSQLVLSRGATGPYKLEKGSLPFLAVGPTTYVLDAEVKGPEGQGNVQVLRTLTFDIFSPQNYAHVSVRPDSVMPNGQVQIKWAVWGVQTASIKVGSRHSLELELTEQNLSRYYQGTGVWRVNAAPNKASEKVRLSITTDGDETMGVTADINANKWEAVEDKPNYTGTPLAMDVTTEGYLGLLTSDGLRTANVGTVDPGLPDPDFKKLPATGKSWHGLTALGPDFVVVRRQSENDNFVIESYDHNGTNKGSVTLPGDFQTIAGRVGASIDLVSYNGRVYVVANASFNRRFGRVAYSVAFAPDAHIRPEPRLSTLNHYRLVCFANALYAYNRGSGRMYRFGVTSNGELGPPHRAASAVNDDGVSMIKTGTVVPIGSLLAVLDPSALPSFLRNPADPITALLNVAGFKVENLQRPLKANETPQDIVYNPQKDAWVACGRGLKVEAGTVLGYRGGKSPRLWAAKPDGTWFKLAGANEKAFAPEFVYQYTTKPLPLALDGVREFTLTNRTGIELVPLDAVCQKGALAPFEADGAAELLTPMPQSLRSFGRHTFKFAYSKDDPSPVILRLMAAGCRGPRYFLEMNLTGADLQRISYGFKRLADDGSVASVPSASEARVGNEVIVSQTGALGQKASLYIMNQTPYNTLLLDPSPGVQATTVWDRVEINYQTPRFKVYVSGQEGLGHVWVDTDFTVTGERECEVAAGNEPQRCRIRLNPDGLSKLEVQSQMLTSSHARMVEFERFDGSKFFIQPSNPDVYVNTCQVRPPSRLVLDAVRLGDGVFTRDGKYIFVPLAKPEDVKKVRIVRIDTQSLETAELAADSPGHVFSLPNAVVLSDKNLIAMFGEPAYHQSTFKFETPSKRVVQGYKELVAIAATPAGGLYYLSKKSPGDSLDVQPEYTLVVEPSPQTSRTEIPLNDFRHSVKAPPLAVSPDGNTAAVGDHAGMLVIDVPGKKVQAFRSFGRLYDPAYVAFSHDGQWMYCLHHAYANNMNRQMSRANDIMLTRVRVGRLNETQTIRFPDVTGDYAVTSRTNPTFRPGDITKELQAGLTLAVTPDNQTLFVSIGLTIMKVTAGNLQPQQWRAATELPSRLVGVKERPGGNWVVYSLGSIYVGDGTKVNEYKTQLYAIPAPKG